MCNKELPFNYLFYLFMNLLHFRKYYEVSSLYHKLRALVDHFQHDFDRLSFTMKHDMHFRRQDPKNFINAFYLRHVRSNSVLLFFGGDFLFPRTNQDDQYVNAFQIIACTGNHRLMKIFDVFFFNLLIAVKIYGSNCKMEIL